MLNCQQGHLTTLRVRYPPHTGSFKQFLAHLRRIVAKTQLCAFPYLSVWSNEHCWNVILGEFQSHKPGVYFNTLPICIAVLASSKTRWIFIQVKSLLYCIQYLTLYHYHGSSDSWTNSNKRLKILSSGRHLWIVISNHHHWSFHHTESPV
jgi:hypothetical protein